MAALLIGAVWAGIVTCLLFRVVQQGRAYAAAVLPSNGSTRASERVAIVVPMRDEIRNVDLCLAGLLRQSGLAANWEVVVVDDNSTDGTAERLQQLAGAEPRLRLLHAGALPPGWIGKSRACWLGAAGSRGEWLCFIDADVRASPLLVASAVAAAAKSKIDMLSLSPFQELGSFWERLVIPAGLLAIAGVMDWRRTADPDSPDVTANGQFLLFRRAAYEALGGHAAVRGEICEDKALAVLVKRGKRRFRMMSAEGLARTRMYRDLSALWEGLAKNAVEILGSALASVAAASTAAAVAWAVIAVPMTLALSLLDAPSAPALAGFSFCLAASFALVGLHFGTARHCGVPLWYVPLFPAAYAAVALLAWSSLVSRATGQVRWKGRSYRIGRKAALGPR